MCSPRIRTLLASVDSVNLYRIRDLARSNSSLRPTSKALDQHCREVAEDTKVLRSSSHRRFHKVERPRCSDLVKSLNLPTQIMASKLRQDLVVLSPNMQRNPKEVITT